MQTAHDLDYKDQIEEAYKRVKNKKVFYLYDETGNKQFLGVFNQKKAASIKEYLRTKNLINRLSETDIRTTEPDSQFDF